MAQSDQKEASERNKMLKPEDKTPEERRIASLPFE